MKITIKEAVELTKVADITIRRWIEDKKISAYPSEKNTILVDKREVLQNLPTVITLFNQKGGVGKTTSSILLADYYEKQGLKVLLVDLDQQANLSRTFFSYEELSGNPSLYNYFNDNTSFKKIVMERNDNISLLPSNIKMANLENTDVTNWIHKVEDFYSFFKKFQIVIIDCPPSLNAFSRLGLLLSHYVFCPLIPEPFCYEGLANAIESIERIIKINKNFIDYKGMVSKHKGQKTIINEDLMEDFRTELQGKLFENTIPEFVGIIERAYADNLFETFSDSEKPMKRVYALLNEIDHFIYEERYNG